MKWRIRSGWTEWPKHRREVNQKVSTETTAPAATDLVTLSLISHTNVGKTTLARTLLRKDVGDALDQPHVTVSNDAYTMLSIPGEGEQGEAELRLWDTPGFGDTARLLRRLKKIERPLGWFVNQVWDRFTDRPLWCSQQAVKNVRDDADVVLYLINASAEEPGAAGYVDMEMKILGWIGKPVIVLLNQSGPPRRPEVEQAEESAWRVHLQGDEVVKAVISLDAFARCWVQEGELLEVIGSVLPKEKEEVYGRLKSAWREKNLAIFDASMEAAAGQIAASSKDSEPAEKERFFQKLGIGRGELNASMKEARNKLAERLAARIQETTDQLVKLHGLSGKSARKMMEITRENFGEPQQVNENLMTILGGVSAGAAGGLAADAAAGGLTFGGGAVVGGIGGGAGAYLLAKGFNLSRGEENGVRWSKGHFRAQFGQALLNYLAVAHFGRGRGEWEDGEPPEFWKNEVRRVTEEQGERIDEVWKDGATQKADLGKLQKEGQAVMTDCTREILKSLYPDAVFWA